jgi:hypothetical protein
MATESLDVLAIGNRQDISPKLFPVCFVLFYRASNPLFPSGSGSLRLF